MKWCFFLLPFLLSTVEWWLFNRSLLGSEKVRVWVENSKLFYRAWRARSAGGAHVSSRTGPPRVTQVVEGISLDVHLLVVSPLISKYRKIFASTRYNVRCRDPWRCRICFSLDVANFQRFVFLPILFCAQPIRSIKRRKEAKSLLLPSIGLATTK